MCDFDYFIRKDVHDFSLAEAGFGWREVAALEVGMTMKMVMWFCHAQEPIDGFESLVRAGVLIMNAEGR